MRKLPALFLLAALCLAQSGRRPDIDRSMLDPTCKPCDDFWRYATGGWADTHPIPADRARWGTFDELRDNNLERLRTILDAASSNSSAKGDERRVGDYYASCMNSASIESAGAKLLYLPPYSPDLNPIENMWSKVKQHLRSAAARTFDALQEAVTAALHTITPRDCVGFFRNCGYVAR